MPPRPGDTIELEVTSLAYGGQGVARVDEFVVFVRGAVYARECFRAAWERTTEREGACPEGVAAAPRAPAVSFGGGPPPEDARYDAGDMGCGDLALELRVRLRRLRPGAVIRVTARDPGARVHPAERWLVVTNAAAFGSAYVVGAWTPSFLLVLVLHHEVQYLAFTWAMARAGATAPAPAARQASPG